MKKKSNKIKAGAGAKRCPPKAKVVRSNRAECTSLPLPKPNQVIEIPQGYEVVQRIGCENFEHRLTLFIRRTNAKRFENDLKSRRSETLRNSAEKPRARSA